MSIILFKSLMQFATLEPIRELGRDNIHKDFWECYYAQGKNYQIANRCVQSNNPRLNYGTNFAFSSLLVWQIQF